MTRDGPQNLHERRRLNVAECAIATTCDIGHDSRGFQTVFRPGRRTEKDRCLAEGLKVLAQDSLPFALTCLVAAMVTLLSGCQCDRTQEWPAALGRGSIHAQNGVTVNLSQELDRAVSESQVSDVATATKGAVSEWAGWAYSRAGEERAARAAYEKAGRIYESELGKSHLRSMMLRRRIGDILGSEPASPMMQQRVSIKQLGVSIQATEVTVAEYRVCVDKEKCPLLPIVQRGTWRNEPSEWEIFPVVYVSAFAADAYCASLGGKLPSVLEWETAARGSGNSAYPWGNEFDNNQHGRWAAVRSGHIHAGPLPPGLFPKDITETGIMDLAGNVAEWTRDDDPAAPEKRLIKGGDWAGELESARIDHVSSNVPARGSATRAPELAP